MRSEVIWPSFKSAIWAIPLTVLVILPGFVDPINLPKLLVLFICAFTATTLFFFLSKFKPITSFSRERKAYIALYTLLILGMVISGLLGSDNRVRVLLGAPGRNNGLIYYLSVVIIALMVLLTYVRRSEIDYLNKTLSITSLLLAAYCALQFLDLDPVTWSNPYNRVIGTLGNPNFSSAALATFSIFWLYQAFRGVGKSVQQRMLLAAPALVMAFLTWSTDALQGLVIVGVGICLVLYVALREKFAARALPWITLVFGGAGLGLLFASFIGIGPLGSSLEQYTLKLRSTYASFGFKAMIESPAYGVGIDNYNSAFRLYRSPEFVGQYGVGLNADNAHSTPAQIGATFGLFVFVLYMILHLLILLRALKVINSRESSTYFLKGVAIVWILIFSQSLLSIELIGLGAMNWILGAVLLSAEFKSDDTSLSERPQGSKKQTKKVLPAWVGSVAIASVVLSAAPIAFIAREDSAYKNIFALQMQGSEDNDWVKLQFSKLSALTLLEPSKVARILENMYNAGMTAEIETTIKELYEANSKDIAANELMAAYYRSISDLEKEIQFREDLRLLDPVNYQLELSLARNYAAKKDIANLQASVARIKSIAPESEEAKVAEQLLKDTSATP